MYSHFSHQGSPWLAIDEQHKPRADVALAQHKEGTVPFWGLMGGRSLGSANQHTRQRTRDEKAAF